MNPMITELIVAVVLLAIVCAVMMWASKQPDGWIYADPMHPIPHLPSEEEEEDEYEKLTCSGTTTDGTPCQRPVAGDEYCWMHEDQAGE